MLSDSPLHALFFKPGQRLNALVGVGVGLVPLASPLMILYLTRHWLGLSALALFVALLLAGVIQREKPIWVMMLAVPYWLAVLFFQVLLAPVAWMMNPVFAAFALLLGAAALASRWYRALAAVVPVVAVLATGLTTAVDMIPSDVTLVFGVAAVGLAGTLVALWLARRGAFDLLSGLAIALFVFNIMTFPRGLMNYKVPFPGDLDKIAAQPGVEPLYAYADPATAAVLPPQIMFMARVPETNKYILGPHDPYKKLYLMTPGDPPTFEELDLGNRGGDNCIFDPDDPSIFYLLGRDNFFRIDTDPLEVLDTLELGYSIMPLSHLRYEPKIDAFVAVRTMTDKVFIIDRKTMTVRRQLDFPADAVSYNAWFDPVADRLYVTGCNLIGWILRVYDTHTWETINQAQWYGISIFDFAISPETRRGFLGSYLSGYVKIIDLDTLKQVDSFFLAPGLRALNYDSYRQLFVAVNHFRGRLHIFSAVESKFYPSLFTGKRIRWVDIDPDRNHYIWTCSAGGFRLAIDDYLYQVESSVISPEDH